MPCLFKTFFARSHWNMWQRNKIPYAVNFGNKFSFHHSYKSTENLIWVSDQILGMKITSLVSAGSTLVLFCKVHSLCCKGLWCQGLLLWMPLSALNHALESLGIDGLRISLWWAKTHRPNCVMLILVDLPHSIENSFKNDYGVIVCLWYLSR